MSERQNIEIDYCPGCRGVWLDRGELDKIIEKTIDSEKPNQQSPNFQQGYSNSNDYKKSNNSYPHKKKHWLSELFD